MKRKYSIQDCRKVASIKGGKCLSSNLELVTDRVIWECAQGHTWQQRFHNIRRGTWCPKCSSATAGEKRKLTIQKMQEVAKSRGGKCLSKQYVNAKTELLWECSCGYQWMAKPVNINVGHWCLKCSHNTPYTKQDLDKLAEKHDGKCLSLIYKTAKSNYTWECQHGHVFTTCWDAVKNQGTWCSKCAGYGRTIKDLQKFARKKGGKCLSSSFHRMQDKTQWECSSGHKWHATTASIYRGSWCPRCRSYYNEEKCRFIIESLTGKDFSKKLISVKNEKFRSMELDGYSQKMHLAFEYHGIQHYQFVRRFHKTVDHFHQLQKKDLRKKEICNEIGIDLITIPYTESQLGEKHLAQFILDQLNDRLILIVESVKFEQFYIQSPLEKLLLHAKTKDGECLSTTYNGPHYKMKWQCQEGHIWLATPASVKNSGRWCPICARKSGGMKRRKHSLIQMKQIAEQHGGDCLSETYEGTHNKLQWKCSKGHVFVAQVMAVLQGQWCRKCRFPERTDN